MQFSGHVCSLKENLVIAQFKLQARVVLSKDVLIRRQRAFNVTNQAHCVCPALLAGRQVVDMGDLPIGLAFQLGPR